MVRRGGCSGAARVVLGVLLVAAAWGLSSRAAFAEELFKERWVYISTNLLVDQNVEKYTAVMERAKKAGYTHVLLADAKFGHLSTLGKDLDKYILNCKRFQAEAKRIGLKVVPSVFPIGWSNSLLAQDVNLAEGVPVRDALFEVQQGRAKVVTDPAAKLLNADFEDAAGDRFAGWTVQDDPGKSTFADHDTLHGGRTSLRMENIDKVDPEHGDCRVMQKVKVKPFRCYHLSVWVKTRDFKYPQGIKLQVEGGKWPALSYKDLEAQPTQDWTRHHVVFNSLDCDEVKIYVGVWKGKSGTVWWDDLAIEEPGLVNVLRRGGCPLKVTSADGTREYVEGKDFEPVSDPKLGMVPYPGQYEPYHTPPDLVLTPGSSIREGDKLLVSFYHPMIVYRGQVTIALSEPRTYEILDDQMKRMHEIFAADAYVLSHDEIRVGNWSPDSTARNMTPGQIIADNVKRCIAILRKYAPNATLYAWSGMFDPNHCACELYYLNNGTLAGAWEGLDGSVVIFPWLRRTRDASMKWFADRGHRQVIAGYYDGPVKDVQEWIEAARKVKGVDGIMYTTWRSKYDDLEAFAEEVKKPEREAGAPPAGGAAAEPAKELILDLGGNVTMKLVLIPPGKFMMGSPETDGARDNDEVPQHEVTFTKPFYVGVTEVTQQQWKAVMDTEPWKNKSTRKDHDDTTATWVTWEGTVEFCKRLSGKTGRTVRLPTEAEWEYACRAGGTAPLCELERGKPNAWGLCDMQGNVWEWCSDWYADSYIGAKTVDPQGPDTGTNHVIRGSGSRRVAHRDRGAGGGAGNSVGFRLGADLKR